MNIKSHKWVMIALVCCLLIAGLAATGLAISDGIKLTLPEEPIINEQVVPPVVPTLISPEEAKWEEMDLCSLAQESTLVYLPEEYEKDAKIMVHLMKEQPEFPSGKVAYAILAEVKYESENKCTLVTLSEASPEACEIKAIYGDTTVSLISGETAFLKENLRGFYPRSIVLVRGDKIITIATTSSRDELIKMAEEVIQTGN